MPRPAPATPGQTRARALPRARALNLSRLADATDAALAPLLAAHAPAALDLSSRTALTGACLDSEALARACTRLSLAACRALRGSALAALARHPLARLHTLDVSDCPQLRDEHLAPLGRGLAVLRAARCDGLSGAFAAGFAGGRLGELNLSGNCNAALGGSARAFAALAGTLTVLSVADCAALTDAHVAALTRLRVLDVSACSGLTSAAFAGLGALQVLYMGGCRQAAMDAGALEHLGAAQGLVVVEMTDCAPALVRAARARGLPVRV